LFLDRAIQKEGLCVHNINNKVEKHFRISIETVRSRGWSLLLNIYYQQDTSLDNMRLPAAKQYQNEAKSVPK
jgi:hypothetical protein